MIRELHTDAVILKQIYEAFDAIALSLPDHMREEFAELLTMLTRRVPSELPSLVTRWRRTNGYDNPNIPEPNGHAPVPEHSQDTGQAHALNGYLQAYGMTKDGAP